MELLFAESSIKGWGTEQHFAALALAMARRGHSVSAVMSPGSPLEALLRARNVPLTVAKFRGSADPRLLRLLHRQVSRRRPDWLVTNDGKFYWPLLLLARLSRARTALFRHWPNMPKNRLTRTLVPRLADRFILVSQFQREFLRRQGIDVAPMRILYNPIDVSELRPWPEGRARIRTAFAATDAQVLIGCVGRMVADKGIFTLFEASESFLAQAPEARLLWMGSGADLAQLRARIAGSAQRDRHLVANWSADMRAVYSSLDLVVVPSQYPDPCPRVPVEAQACAVPVVCSDAGGLPETFAVGGSGLITPAGDAARLSEAILTLVRDPERRRRMGLAGREFACAKFSFERVAEDFEALLAGSSPGASLA